MQLFDFRRSNSNTYVVNIAKETIRKFLIAVYLIGIFPNIVYCNKHDNSAHASETITQGTGILNLEAYVLTVNYEAMKKVTSY